MMRTLVALAALVNAEVHNVDAPTLGAFLESYDGEQPARPGASGWLSLLGVELDLPLFPAVSAAAPWHPRRESAISKGTY